MAADKQAFRTWCHDQLSSLLGFPAGFELIDYVLTFESSREIKEHLSSLLDIRDNKSKEFVNEFVTKWSLLQKNQMQATDTGFTKLEESFMRKQNQKQKIITKSPPIHIKAENIDDDNALACTPPSQMSVDTTGAEFLDKNKLLPEEQSIKKTPSPFKKKNLKYVPLYSSDGKLKTDTILLPGRNPCKCLAQRHKLINNCVYCGRIVCEQEGSGPCMFCGNMVCTPEEGDIISRDSKKSKKLMEKLLSQTVPDESDEDFRKDKKDDGLEKAVAHRNKLLDYGKNSTKRTKVIDDEADYFSYDNDKWLTKKQKAALQKRNDELRDKRFASRLDKKYIFDFAGRRIIEDEQDSNMYNEDDEVVQSVSRLIINEGDPVINEGSLVDPRITMSPPKFVGHGFDTDVTTFLKKQQEAVKNSLNINEPIKRVLRLQDKELQQISDHGMCMSMHQPWASLLIHGIKKLEGRSWYSAHRGRLWIASTAKEADNESIQHLEQHYKNTYPNEDLDFPQDYPSGALLGCVNVVDVAENEEYFKNHPSDPEESDSPYLFVCDNPQQLKFKFSMKGKHKIYKLEPHIHAGARKSLMYS